MRRTLSVPPECFSALFSRRTQAVKPMIGWMIRIYHHTSQLRANSERAPLNSPSVSGHRLLCASLLVFSYLPLGRCCCCRRRLSRFVFPSAQTPLSGALPLFSSAAALLFQCVWKRRWCVSPAAGGTKFAAKTAIPPRCCGYRATVHFVVFVVDRNQQGRCFTRASPPVASGRLQSPPVCGAVAHRWAIMGPLCGKM